MKIYLNQDLKNVDYMEMNRYLKLYSGNLDTKEIREISKKRGVTVGELCKAKSFCV